MQSILHSTVLFECDWCLFYPTNNYVSNWSLIILRCVSLPSSASPSGLSTTLGLLLQPLFQLFLRLPFQQGYTYFLWEDNQVRAPTSFAGLLDWSIFPTLGKRLHPWCSESTCNWHATRPKLFALSPVVLSRFLIFVLCCQHVFVLRRPAYRTSADSTPNAFLLYIMRTWFVFGIYFHWTLSLGVTVYGPFLV